MIKVVMVGAGSVVFSRNLTNDILSFPEFKNAEFVYVDIDPVRLKVGRSSAARPPRCTGPNPRFAPRSTAAARFAARTSSSTWCRSAGRPRRWWTSRFPASTA